MKLYQGFFICSIGIILIDGLNCLGTYLKAKAFAWGLVQTGYFVGPVCLSQKSSLVSGNRPGEKIFITNPSA